MKVVIVLLTWQRLHNLKNTLKSLRDQTYKDFTIHVTNANLNKVNSVSQVVKYYQENFNLDIHLTNDGNEKFAWRRFDLGREYALKGYDAVMYIDDDVTFDKSYVQSLITGFEKECYGSNYTWKFTRHNPNYYTDRVRVRDNSEPIKYCGTGMSIVDAKVFLEDGLFEAPETMYKIEDLWLSYYCDHVLGWKLKYIDIPNVALGGGDRVALYREIRRSKSYTKADALTDLTKLGWNLRVTCGGCGVCGS